MMQVCPLEVVVDNVGTTDVIPGVGALGDIEPVADIAGQGLETLGGGLFLGSASDGPAGRRGSCTALDPDTV
ncbi:hypothetical protein [Nocardia grenadensis]|uniref:hypothetical protein n=1 Tax=Nocardia grenadensis TaxID=931537 RepID=UPI003D72D870